MQDPQDPGFGEGSQYAAHLNRGWQLFEKGDLVAAQASAARARELNPNVPDASMLLAALAMADGDAERSLEHYDAALETDGEYVEAHLAACQVLAYDLDRPEQALERLSQWPLDEVTAIERLELRLLEAECHLATDSRSAARRILEGRMPDASGVRLILDSDVDAGAREDELLSLFGGFEMLDLEPGETLDAGDLLELEDRALGFAVRLGRAWLDAERSKRAVAWFEAAVGHAPQFAEAWAGLADARHADNDLTGSIRAAVETARLDANTPLPDWAPGAVEVQQAVLAALQDSGIEAARVAAEDESLVILVQEAPPLEFILEGSDPRVPVMAVGAAVGQHGRGDRVRQADVELTGIAIYRRNLIRSAGAPGRIESTLKIALEMELAQFFGVQPADA